MFSSYLLVTAIVWAKGLDLITKIVVFVKKISSVRTHHRSSRSLSECNGAETTPFICKWRFTRRLADIFAGVLKIFIEKKKKNVRTNGKFWSFLELRNGNLNRDERNFKNLVFFTGNRPRLACGVRGIVWWAFLFKNFFWFGAQGQGA